MSKPEPWTADDMLEMPAVLRDLALSYLPECNDNTRHEQQVCFNLRELNDKGAGDIDCWYGDAGLCATCTRCMGCNRLTDPETRAYCGHVHNCNPRIYGFYCDRWCYARAHSHRLTRNYVKSDVYNLRPRKRVKYSA
jgi:hypothetical protein